MPIRELCAYAFASELVRFYERQLSTYHRFDVGMGYGIKLVESKLVIGANVYVGPFVFCTVAILGSGENCSKVSEEGIRMNIKPYR